MITAKKPTFLSLIKNRLVPSGKKPRMIRAGIFQGITMNIDLTYQTQLYLGLFERELHFWLKQFSKNVRTAIDIGAAEGEYTLYFLRKTSAERVFSFEPEKSLHAPLMANMQLNKVSEDSRLKFFQKYVGSINNDHQCTLDSLLNDILLPCLIKMDVDGPEVEILRGATELLKIHGSSWIIETHSPQLELECFEILRHSGLIPKIIKNSWWRLFIPELRPIEQNRWLVAQQRK